MNEEPRLQKLRRKVIDAADRGLTVEEVLPTLDEASTELAEKLGKAYEERIALRRRLIEGLSPRGRLRRNTPCPCGSGRKFKKCCQQDFKMKTQKQQKPKHVLVCGVAVNDVGETRVNGRPCPRYKIWLNMINRCYSGDYPAYADCEVVDDWKQFSVFRNWLDTQDWVGKELDKDILGDGCLYSPETCCFVPRWLNSLFTTPLNSPYPRGVFFDTNRQKFVARISIYNQTKNLGRFETKEKALAVYNKARLEYVMERLTNYPDDRVKAAAIAKCTPEKETTDNADQH